MRGIPDVAFQASSRTAPLVYATLEVDVTMADVDGIETGLRIRRRHPDVVVLLLLTATRRASVSDPSLMVEDKRDLSHELLADFWRRHGQSR
jgi:DNA-binding response OmpR family regulator